MFSGCLCVELSYVSICFSHVNYLRDYFQQNAEYSIEAE